MPRNSKFGEINKKLIIGIIIVTIVCALLTYLLYLHYKNNTTTPSPKSSTFGAMNYAQIAQIA
jgi:flagellar basal body-associated protein FliL